MTIELANYILGIMIAIIGFFTKGLISQVNKMEEQINDNKSNIAVLSTKHDNVERSLNEIKGDMKELIKAVNSMPEKLRQNV